MECLPFRKRSPLTSPHFFVLLILQISFSKNGFRHPPDPIKNKNGSSLLTETKQSVRDTRRGFGPFPAKVGCIYRNPRPTVNLNFASRETIDRSEEPRGFVPLFKLPQKRLGLLDPRLISILLERYAVRLVRQEIGQLLPGRLLFPAFGMKLRQLHARASVAVVLQH